MEPQLSVVCFRYRPPDDTDTATDADLINRAIIDRLRRETGVVPSSTVVDGRFAIRPCLINPRTTEREVEGLVEAVVRFGDQLVAARP